MGILQIFQVVIHDSKEFDPNDILHRITNTIPDAVSKERPCTVTVQKTFQTETE